MVVVADNTYGPGLFRPMEWGAHVSINAATKYISKSSRLFYQSDHTHKLPPPSSFPSFPSFHRISLSLPAPFDHPFIAFLLLLQPFRSDSSQLGEQAGTVTS